MAVVKLKLACGTVLGSWGELDKNKLSPAQDEKKRIYFSEYIFKLKINL
jgi:hypothetical protein